jgi:hypothetical protein
MQTRMGAVSAGLETPVPAVRAAIGGDVALKMIIGIAVGQGTRGLDRAAGTAKNNHGNDEC